MRKNSLVLRKIAANGSGCFSVDVERLVRVPTESQLAFSSCLGKGKQKGFEQTQDISICFLLFRASKRIERISQMISCLLQGHLLLVVAATQAEFGRQGCRLFFGDYFLF